MSVIQMVAESRSEKRSRGIPEYDLDRSQTTIAK